MATQAQILANRRNAQKSTGPKTPKGKAVVSKNALKHGLTARYNLIKGESPGEFARYRNEMLAELDPVGPVETTLAERIVSLAWRLKRIIRIQNQALDSLNTTKTLSPLNKLAQSLLSKSGGRTLHDSSDTNLDLGRLAVRDFTNARVLERLLMYERRIENSLYKTMLMFQRLNLIRKLHSQQSLWKNRL